MFWVEMPWLLVPLLAAELSVTVTLHVHKETQVLQGGKRFGVLLSSEQTVGFPRALFSLNVMFLLNSLFK